MVVLAASGCSSGSGSSRAASGIIFHCHVRTADAFANDVHGFTLATFPGTTERAYAPEITYPFFTAMWISG